MLVTPLDLVVVGVEHDTVLDHLKRVMGDVVASDTDFLQAEVQLEDLTNLYGTLLADPAVEQVQLLDAARL